MTKMTNSRDVLLWAVSLVAGTLGFCGTVGAQSRVRMGVSVSVPIRTQPMSEGDKGTITGVLIVIGVLVAVAVVGVCLVFLYCFLADAWARVTRPSHAGRDRQAEIRAMSENAPVPSIDMFAITQNVGNLAQVMKAYDDKVIEVFGEVGMIETGHNANSFLLKRADNGVAFCTLNDVKHLADLRVDQKIKIKGRYSHAAFEVTNDFFFQDCVIVKTHGANIGVAPLAA